MPARLCWDRSNTVNWRPSPANLRSNATTLRSVQSWAVYSLQNFSDNTRRLLRTRRWPPEEPTISKLTARDSTGNCRQIQHPDGRCADCSPFVDTTPLDRRCHSSLARETMTKRWFLDLAVQGNIGTQTKLYRKLYHNNRYFSEATPVFIHIRKACWNG